MRARLLWLACVLPVAAHAATVTTFNLPLGDKTCGLGISLNGIVVGQDLSKTNPTVSFVYLKGHFGFPKPLLPPGLITVTGINRHGVMVGSDLVSGGQPTANTFSFKFSAGVTSMLTLTGVADTSATDINDAGMVVGSLQMAGVNEPTLGFVYTGADLTTLNYGPGSTYATGINQNGTAVTGYSLAETTLSSWLYQNGTYTGIAFPRATVTVAHGVFGAGWVTGTYYTGIVPNLIAHGFVYHDGHYNKFDVTGASQTMINGANEGGQFTGCYIDAAGTHGMIGALR